MAELPARPLSDSVLQVSIAGLGCNNFGRRIDLEATRAVADAAIEEGITFFDTADIYGRGASEEFLGEVLQGRRDRVVLATKFGMDLGDGKGPRPDALLRIQNEYSLLRREAERDVLPTCQRLGLGSCRSSTISSVIAGATKPEQVSANAKAAHWASRCARAPRGAQKSKLLGGPEEPAQRLTMSACSS